MNPNTFITPSLTLVKVFATEIDILNLKKMKKKENKNKRLLCNFKPLHVTASNKLLITSLLMI